MASHNDEPQSYKPNSSSEFQVPSKERRVIAITAPKPQPQRPKPQPKSTSKPSANSSTSTTIRDARQSTSSSVPKSVSAKPVPTRESQAVKVSESESESSRVQSLDIYAPKYVPQWLRAVNDSNATIKQCKPLQTLDYAIYVASFAGSGFLQPLPGVQPPPLVPVHLSHEQLTVEHYATYWNQRLQNEFATQTLQNQFFALYAKILTVYDRMQQLFMLNVPGLRENAPRIDIGDVIHVRPLSPHIPDDIMTQTAVWTAHEKQKGFLAPGFSGQLYMAIVWGMNRAKEEVVLRIDGFDGFDAFKCNIVFPLQEPKLEPICRAVQEIKIHLASNDWLRRMLFPEADHGVLQTTLSQATFGVDWVDDVLNWEQKKAIHSVLSKNYGDVPYLISGPPGTGKTKTLVELALQFLRQTERHHNLLICAPSDSAADTLALRLSQHLKPHTLFRLNSWTRTFAELPDRLLPYTHTDNNLFSLPRFDLIMSYRVIVTTCRDADILVKARLTNSALARLVSGINGLISMNQTQQPLHWTALLLDEAAQATEPDAMIPLSVVMPPSSSQNNEMPQFVAAGDQYQLGPKLLTKSSLSTSFFQRLFERDAYTDHPLSRKKGSVNTTNLTSKMLPMMRPAFTNLVRNYRSHPAILSVPSMLFYNDTLITERKGSAHITEWPGWSPSPSPSQSVSLKWPVLFYQNDGEDAYESITEGDGTGSGTLYNAQEARIALTLTKSLLRHSSSSSDSTSPDDPPLHPREIMIMTPFRAQVTHLRTKFRRAKLYDVNIGPLEAFQGLESRIVIICTTRTRLSPKPPPSSSSPVSSGNGNGDRSHYVRVDKSRALGIIDEPQRFNVAITRAKDGLIVIGNPPCLLSTGDAQWKEFLAFCERNGCLNPTPTPNFNPAHSINTTTNATTNKTPARIGRLERAMHYASRGKLLFDQQQQNHESTRSRSKATTTTDTKPKSKFKLHGPRVEMDEEMWRFKELAQHRDSECIDLGLIPNFDDNDDDDDIVETFGSREHDDEDHGEEDKNDDDDKDFVNENENEQEQGWDRDLQREFYEGCANQ